MQVNNYGLAEGLSFQLRSCCGTLPSNRMHINNLKKWGCPPGHPSFHGQNCPSKHSKVNHFYSATPPSFMGISCHFTETPNKDPNTSKQSHQIIPLFHFLKGLLEAASCIILSVFLHSHSSSPALTAKDVIWSLQYLF